MFLSAILFAMLLAGCWLYCLTDAALTPATEFRGLGKRSRIAVITVTFAAGAFAWLVTRLAQRKRTWPPQSANRPPPTPVAAPGRHPASRSRRLEPRRTRPIGPDDDPDFLRMLDRFITGTHSGE
jgi:hypothetical protein